MKIKPLPEFAEEEARRDETRHVLAQLVYEAYPEIDYFKEPVPWERMSNYPEHTREERSSHGITVIACYRAAEAIMASFPCTYCIQKAPSE